MTREATNADRRSANLRAFVGAATADARDTRIYLDDDGPAAALAVFHVQQGTDPVLGMCSGDLKRMYACVAHGVQDLLIAGYTQGSFTISDPTLLRILVHTFRISPEPEGYEPNSRVVKQWTVTVDLADALDQLLAVR